MESLALAHAPVTRIAAVGSFFAGLREKSPPFSMGESVTAEVVEGLVGSLDNGKGAGAALLFLLLMLLVGEAVAVMAVCFSAGGGAFVLEG